MSVLAGMPSTYDEAATHVVRFSGANPVGVVGMRPGGT